jgi:Ser/Thr protein kinase RdoA (MazF antagonist)
VTETNFPVQDSTLSAEALTQRVLRRYSLPGQPVCRFFRKGICDTYRVKAGDQVYFLKAYRHARRTELDVAEEMRLLTHLIAHDVSVARPVARMDGGGYLNALPAPEGTRYAVLFEAAPGTPGDQGDPARIRAFGEMVGRMHLVMDQMEMPYRRAHLDMQHLLDENLAPIAQLMARRSEDFELIACIVEACRQRVADLLPKSKPEYGICHGDLHGGDVHYQENGTPILFDFDSSGCGWRALDIGVFLVSDAWMDITVEAEARRQGRLARFLDGYAAVRQLTEAELTAVQIAPPIRYIFLMGFVLRYTVPREGEHWANDTFIDWHMAWFRHWADKSL